MTNPGFWKGRRVLLTGHSGFKGAWAAAWLHGLGAAVTGLALPPDTEPSLWREIEDDLGIEEHHCDLADREAVARIVRAAEPEIVLHLAAQSLVRRSYRDPVGTFATNVMGTVHLLDALRQVEPLRAVLIVTTDKVYANDDLGRDFTEKDRLGGRDPYSASKACAELATASLFHSFFAERSVPVATARAGNVIGGGDWSEDRLLPDVWRAIVSGRPLALRHPEATRPWQHVTEPIAGYLLYAEALAKGGDVPPALNFGPLPGERLNVAELADSMSRAMGSVPAWRRDEGDGPHEMKHLSLDPSAAVAALGWRPRLSGEEAVEWSADWYRAHRGGAAAIDLCRDQIARYEALAWA